VSRLIICGDIPPFLLISLWHGFQLSTHHFTFPFTYFIYALRDSTKQFVTLHVGCIGGWGAAQVRQDEVLPSMGILHVCILLPAFTTPMSPKEIHFADFRRFTSGQQVITLIQYTVLTVIVERGRWKWSLHHYISLLKFKFTHGTFWSLILKFTIFSFMSMEYDRPFVITSCINILIWTINFCCWEINFVKMIT